MSKKTISYYGKLPSHGDFISQHTPRAFTGVWDTWLQESMLQWRNKLSEGWVADYMTMQPYRFILSSGIAGEVIWCGVLFPSRDKSGRLFPFTACIPLSPKETTPIELFTIYHQWLEKLEQLTLGCFRPDFDTDKFRQYQQNLDKLAEQCPEIATQSNNYTCKNNTESNIQSTSFAWHSTSLKNTTSTTIINNALVNSLLNEYCHSHSLWWTNNNANFMLCQGLPDIDLTPALIDQQWGQWGWLVDTHLQQNDDETQVFKVPQ
jgi:type VI secretion system protein ImpM